MQQATNLTDVSKFTKRYPNHVLISFAQTSTLTSQPIHMLNVFKPLDANYFHAFNLTLHTMLHTTHHSPNESYLRRQRTFRDTRIVWFISFTSAFGLLPGSNACSLAGARGVRARSLANRYLACWHGNRRHMTSCFAAGDALLLMAFIIVIISERELTLTFAIRYRPSVCRLSVVCHL